MLGVYDGRSRLIETGASGSGQGLHAGNTCAHDQSNQDRVFDGGGPIFAGQEPLRLTPKFLHFDSSNYIH